MTPRPSNTATPPCCGLTLYLLKPLAVSPCLGVSLNQLSLLCAARPPATSASHRTAPAPSSPSSPTCSSLCEHAQRAPYFNQSTHAPCMARSVTRRCTHRTAPRSMMPTRCALPSSSPPPTKCPPTAPRQRSCWHMAHCDCTLHPHCTAAGLLVVAVIRGAAIACREE